MGKEIEALMEEEKVIHGKRYMVGYTKAYVKVAFATEEDLSNCFIRGCAKELLNQEYLLLER